MVGQITHLLVLCIAACAEWLDAIFNASGTRFLWLGAFVVWAMYRFMLEPLFGVAASDTARKVWSADARGSKGGNSGSKGG